MKNFSKLTDNLLIFFVAQISIVFLPHQAWTQHLCVDLFNSKQISTSPFDHNFADNESFNFPSTHFRKLFIHGQHGNLNFQQSGQNFKTLIDDVPMNVRFKRAEEIEHLINLHLKQTSSLSRYADLWSALIVLNPNHGIEFFAQHLRSNFFKASDLVNIADFVRSFDPKVAEALAQEVLIDYEYLNKFPNPIETYLSPKRAALYISKVLLQWPKKLKNRLRNGSIRFGDYNHHLNQVRKLTNRPNEETTIVSAKQVGLVIKIFQDELKKWCEQNPSSENNISIVLTGSLPNGFPTNFHSDIDVMIFNQNFRNVFFAENRRLELQRSIYQILRKDGYTGPDLPLTDLIGSVHINAPNHFNSQKKVVEHGFLGTISFEIFPDHVDLIIHDQPTAENNHAIAERFRTE